MFRFKIPEGTFAALVKKEHMLGTEIAAGVPQVAQLPVGNPQVFGPLGNRTRICFQKNFRGEIEGVSRGIGIPVVDDTDEREFVDRPHETGGME